ncbi:peptide chain release factor N(5)-glutamine methyltransferase [Nioella aestuarii]|uniref:peptide chain release factor N(5)-glutamine methyltransferase n=1 Tax=Nioella aestuarii TaxID=1662864 RepID=UPI003D7FF934
MTLIREALAEATLRLTSAGIDGAARDARWLLAKATGIERGRLTLHLGDPLTEEAEFFFYNMMLEREARVPLSHVIQGREFFGRWFSVSPDVLDPRPETEILVQAALEVPFREVLDLGTGSGAILLTLLAERLDATGTGTDISGPALAKAEENARALGVADRMHLEHGRWYEPVGGRYDLIVSNPPYIALDEMAGLSPEVRDHEPRVALTDEADGLSAYRAITARILDHLTPGGWLMVEIGPTQGAAVSDMFRAAGLEDVRVCPDLDGRDRVVMGRKPA